MRTIQIDIRPITSRLGSLLLAALLLVLTAVPAAAQDVPTDGLLLRLQDDAPEASSELAALEAELDRPTPYTAAVIHPHNGRWSVTVSQGTLEDGSSLSRFLHDETAEFFLYDRILDENERNVLHKYLTSYYNASEADGSDGLNQGIRVQGNWSIEVRNPDGSLAERRDFENAIADGGPEQFSNSIAGNRTTGPIAVRLDSDNPPCERQDGTESGCMTAEPGWVTQFDHFFNTLAVEVPSSGEDEGAIVLSGDVTAQRDGEISVVETQVMTCSPDTAPSNCDASMDSGGGKLTRTTPQDDIGQNPVSVTEGQQVNVTVVISFN